VTRTQEIGCVFVASEPVSANQGGLSLINLSRASLDCQKPPAINT